MAESGVFQFCRQGTTKVELTPLDVISADILLHSRGLSYGLGVFETLAVIESHIILEDAHFARMQNGANILHLDFVLELAKRQVADFLSDKKGSGALKITLLASQSLSHQARGYGALGSNASLFILHFSPLPPTQLSQSLYRIPESCFPWPLALAGLKMTSAVQYVHWASYALQQGADQGVLFDHRGYLIECTTSNIVIYDKAGQWYTPYINFCGVNGVLRQFLIEKRIIVEKDLVESDLCEARQVYVINSLRGFQRIISYEGQNYSQSWGQATLDENTQSFEAYVDDIFTPYANPVNQ